MVIIFLTLLSETIQEKRKNHYSFCGFLSSVPLYPVTNGLHRKNISTSTRDDRPTLDIRRGGGRKYPFGPKVLQSIIPDLAVDMTVTYFSSHRRLGPKSDQREINSHPCARRTLHPFCVVFHACTVAELLIPGIVVLGYRVEMASTQEVEKLRRQLDELTAQMIEMRQQSPSTAMNAAVSGFTEAVRTMGQSVSKPRPEDMRVGKPEPYAQGKDFDSDFTFNGCAGTLDPAHPAFLKTARQSPTVVMATPPHEQQSATCCTSSRCSHRKEHGKW